MTRASLLVAIAVTVGCGGNSDKPVAELAAAAGLVEGNQRGSADWRPSATGTRYRDGDAVRTGGDSSARVAMLRGSGTLRMGSRSVIRFGKTGGLPGIALETGEAEIETGADPLLVETSAGRARLRPGSRARLVRGPDGTRLTVVMGLAQIETGGADGPVDVAAGDAVMLSARGVSPAPLAPPDAGQPPIDAGPPPDAPARPKELRLGKRTIDVKPPPATTDLAAPVGDLVIIHDPKPPARIALAVQACDGESVVELKRGRKRSYYRGTGSVAVELARGTTNYRVLCADGEELSASEQRGKLRLLRDDGRRRVRTRAPKNRVEADGRTYRLVYQNRKPTITFAWPNAPKADRYQLVLTPRRGGARRYKSAKPRYTLTSGKVAEGSYSWRFEAGDQRSKTTRLLLDFDNAAPVAQLDPARWSADSIEVRGLVTVGSSVAIDGADVALDGDYRFRAKLARKPGQNSVAIRIVRPGGSVHYYVERAPARR